MADKALVLKAKSETCKPPAPGICVGKLPVESRALSTGVDDVS